MTDAAISLHDFIDAFGDSVPEDIHPSALCGSSVPRSRVSRPNTTDIGSTERQIPKFSGFGKESSMATTFDPSAAAVIRDIEEEANRLCSEPRGRVQRLMFEHGLGLDELFDEIRQLYWEAEKGKTK
jgi:hypothetical protein